MPKVLIVIITKDYVERETLDSVIAQGVDWIIVGKHPEVKTGDFFVDLYSNCSATRDHARKFALVSGADYILFMDSDIVLPINAVKNLLKQVGDGKRIIGGWYNCVNDRNRWVCGNWANDNVFINYRAVQPSLVKVDMVGLGCAIVPFDAVNEIDFKHGLNHTSINENGERVIVGECGIFGVDATNAGYSLYMDGSVVCGHLKRN